MAGKHPGRRRSHADGARRRAAIAGPGTAAGVLLAAAFLQTAVAFADTDVFSLVPVGPETVEATYDFLPGVLEISSGTQEFDLDDPSIAGDPTVGTVDADVINTDFLGVTNSEFVVTSDLTDTTGEPAVGSVYDTTIFGDTGYHNVFTEVLTVGATVPSVTDTFDTPYGDYTARVALHLLSFYWHDNAALFASTAATTATTDGLGTSSADGLASIVADLGSVF
jgi:hypothetical protein